MKKGLLILAASLMSLAPVAATAQVRSRVVVARPHYYYGGGFYRPYWGSYWGPTYNPTYFYNPDSGTVKLDTKVKGCRVYINGAYAGTTKDNKTMHLRPGEYKHRDPRLRAAFCAARLCGGRQDAAPASRVVITR
jgi:hypothetical protein